MLRSVVSNSLQPHAPARLLCPWNFPGKNTGVGCHFLFQQRFSGQEKVVRLSGMASLLTEWKSKAWSEKVTCWPPLARWDEDILALSSSLATSKTVHWILCTLLPGEGSSGFIIFAEASVTSQNYESLGQVSNSPSPLSPASHCLCPASITCNLSSYNTLPWGMLALGVICSLCCYRRALPKMQTYPYHCPAYRTTVVHTGHQDKNLSGGCPIHSSMSPPLLSL